MKDLQKRLEKELDSMVRRLGRTGPVGAGPQGHGEAATETSCGDETDQIVIGQERELRFDARDRLVTRVNRIIAALARMNRGEYGVCLECGARIPPARLHALPEVETCVSCQTRMERQGQPCEAAPSR